MNAVDKMIMKRPVNHIIDADIKGFFDRVNHDRLLSRLATKIEDKRVLKLIRRYLTAGIMIDGLVSPSLEGTPQGGPAEPPRYRSVCQVVWEGSSVMGSPIPISINQSFCHIRNGYLSKTRLVQLLLLQLMYDTVYQLLLSNNCQLFLRCKDGCLKFDLRISKFLSANV